LPGRVLNQPHINNNKKETTMKKLIDWITACANTGFLKDANGQQSIMRLLTIVIAAAIIGVWVIVNIVSNVHGALKTGTLDIIDFKPQMVYVLLTAVLGKAVQKFAEKTDDAPSAPTPKETTDVKDAIDN
jgi:hypothetical protein